MSLIERYQNAVVEISSQMLAHGEAHFIVESAGHELTFTMIFESEMDLLTHQLERDGLRIWFDCEVDGVEYRLAARQ